jgi:L-2-hydroxyglutarate oxidase LhgO
MRSKHRVQLDAPGTTPETAALEHIQSSTVSDRVDCVVIGAGVVGLAVARELANAGREVIVVEQNAAIGMVTSSRNSEVIHAGLYYPTGSLKALLCVTGKSLLYDYCERRQVPFRRIGKLIVATDVAQLDRLSTIAEQAHRNGVDDLAPIDEAELKRREPQIRGVAALWSPSTGIIDSHALMIALEGDLEARDGIVATQSRVRAIHVADDGVRLQVQSGDAQSELIATTVINSAGLDAIALARQCTGLDTSNLPRGYFAKGSYFVYDGNSPFQSLVYPLPVDGGLGVHATLDLGGKLRFGPDVEWVDAIDYSIDESRRDSFAASIRTYWPSIHAEDLVPGYTGIRPKLSGPGEPAADFKFEIAAAGNKRQLVHLLGIESPGLTASLAIAIEVRHRIDAAVKDELEGTTR